MYCTAKTTSLLSIQDLITLLTLFVLSLKGIPVLIVKIHQLKRLKSIKAKGFSTFLLGTHPRLGEDSPVLMLAGTRSLNIGENVSKDFLLMISCLLIIKETILRKSEYQQKVLKFKQVSEWNYRPIGHNFSYKKILL